MYIVSLVGTFYVCRILLSFDGIPEVGRMCQLWLFDGLVAEDSCLLTSEMIMMSDDDDDDDDDELMRLYVSIFVAVLVRPHTSCAVLLS